ncbi:hypothetical protein GCM10009801_12580 [Streptomyces albiaxialis]|uniref:Ricin B lectin domain-containing protein n=1 Tax=Streptomyces albiaxialis TaxID=329523 RepID=A0ABN2VNQ1_9ACTN
MNRGDDADESTGTSTPFAVIISGDGSASIDGEPVPVVPGEPLDAAVLDTLHGYARSRDAAVTATITDPSVDHVTVVEVQPDGSSTMLEQVREEEPPAEAPALLPEPPSGNAPGAGLGAGLGSVSGGGSGASGGASGSGGGSGGGAGSGSGAGLGRPRMPSLSLPAVRVRNPLRKKGGGGSSQSDDEYEGPGLLERPMVVGGVAIGVVTLVIGSLVAVASAGSGDDGPKNGAADSTGEKGDHRLKTPKPGTVTPSPSDRSSPPVRGSSDAEKDRSDKDSEDSKGPKDSGDEDGHGSGDEPKPKPGGDKPKPPPDKGSPKSVDALGAVLVKNARYGTCLDLPGLGKGQPDGKVQDDYACDGSPGGNQTWAVKKSAEAKGKGGRNLYTIRNVKDGLCLDLPYYDAAPSHTPVTEFHCDSTNNDNQLWGLYKRPDGSYWIRNHKSHGMCLDLARTNEKAKNVDLLIVPCKVRDDHEWQFVKG